MAELLPIEYLKDTKLLATYGTYEQMKIEYDPKTDKISLEGIGTRYILSRKRKHLIKLLTELQPTGERHDKQT